MSAMATAGEVYAMKLLLIRLMADFGTKYDKPATYLDSFIKATLQDVDRFSLNPDGPESNAVRSEMKACIEGIAAALKASVPAFRS